MDKLGDPFTKPPYVQHCVMIRQLIDCSKGKRVKGNSKDFLCLTDISVVTLIKKPFGKYFFIKLPLDHCAGGGGDSMAICFKSNFPIENQTLPRASPSSISACCVSCKHGDWKCHNSLSPQFRLTKSPLQCT